MRDSLVAGNEQRREKESFDELCKKLVERSVELIRCPMVSPRVNGADLAGHTSQDFGGLLRCIYRASRRICGEGWMGKQGPGMGAVIYHQLSRNTKTQGMLIQIISGCFSKPSLLVSTHHRCILTPRRMKEESNRLNLCLF